MISMAILEKGSLMTGRGMRGAGGTLCPDDF